MSAITHFYHEDVFVYSNSNTFMILFTYFSAYPNDWMKLKHSGHVYMDFAMCLLTWPWSQQYYFMYMWIYIRAYIQLFISHIFFHLFTISRIKNWNLKFETYTIFMTLAPNIHDHFELSCMISSMRNLHVCVYSHIN